ncbi:MAG: tRNA lysidine(34) synthetase TilS [Candidatus Margulisiibacteriota bacterium]|jgi:tRNA(Ile)-lysidine synthase
MLTKINDLIIKNELFTPKDHLLVGISGGPDSVCLVLVLLELGYKHLSLVHVNHKLRGESSQRDAKFVQKLGRELKLPVYISVVDTNAYAKKKKLSIEDAARQLRFNCFAKLAIKLRASKLVLAHNANDQVETVLIKLIRGSGNQGLLGIEPLRNIDGLTVARPLLTTWRKEIMGFLKIRKQSCCLDHTNSQPIYLRNKVRLSILPQLEKLNPNIGQTILRMTDILQEEEKYLRGESQCLATAVIKEKNSKGSLLDKKKFYSLPLAMQRRVLRLVIEEVQGHLENVSLLYIDNFLENKLTTIKLDKRGILHTSKEKLR